MSNLNLINQHLVATAPGRDLINKGLDNALLKIAGGLAGLADVTRPAAHKKC
jgi:hypothetical protein